jgi:hypothetical protein
MLNESVYEHLASSVRFSSRSASLLAPNSPIPNPNRRDLIIDEALQVLILTPLETFATSVGPTFWFRLAAKVSEGQAARMNQLGGSGIGSADVPPLQHQQMEDVMGLSDPMLVALRNNYRQRM